MQTHTQTHTHTCKHTHTHANTHANTHTHMQTHTHANTHTHTHFRTHTQGSNVKVSAHWVRHFCMLKNKYDFTLCQSRLHTASETSQKNQIRFDFLCFRIRIYLNRKGWRIRKTPCAMALTLTKCHLWVKMAFVSKYGVTGQFTL